MSVLKFALISLVLATAALPEDAGQDSLVLVNTVVPESMFSPPCSVHCGNGDRFGPLTATFYKDTYAPSTAPEDTVMLMTGAEAHQLFCPNEGDLIVSYTTKNSTNSLMDGGWTNKGGGAVATRSSFNLLGGYVEYDIDLTGVKTKVNANIYTVSPKFDGDSFQKSDYCDGSKTGDKWCVEVDWIESNGDCGGATTLHTVEGKGKVGCTASGCQSSYRYSSKFNGKMRMRIDYQDDGTWTTTRNGVLISPSDLKPTPRSEDWAVLKQQYEEKGAVIYSSIWTGWVPQAGCDDSEDQGDLVNSVVTVSNLVISGTVVQGLQPTVCAGPPTVSPSPPTCVDPKDGKTSDGTTCSKQKGLHNCGKPWMLGWCCKTCFDCSGSDSCGGKETAYTYDSKAFQ